MCIIVHSRCMGMGISTPGGQALAATEAELATLQRQNEALHRDVERFQQRERLLQEVCPRVPYPSAQVQPEASTEQMRTQ